VLCSLQRFGWPKLEKIGIIRENDVVDIELTPGVELANAAAIAAAFAALCFPT